jgi:SSS family solute:Na+ symporter
VAFVVDVVLSVIVSLVTRPKPAGELKGLVYSETPRSDLVDEDAASYPWYQRPVPLAGVALVIVIVLNAIF